MSDSEDQTAPDKAERRAAQVDRARKKYRERIKETHARIYRRGRTVGVMSEGGRRYRLATLGLAEAYTEAEARFDLFESRMSLLTRGRPRERNHERDL